MKLAERYEVVIKCNLCFSCLGSGNGFGQCKANRTCDKDSCSECHNRHLHSDDSKLETQKKKNSSNGTNKNADAVLTANSCSGSLQIVAITLSRGATFIDTMAISESGSKLSFVDEDNRDHLGVRGNGITLNIAGTNGTMEMASERLMIKVTTPNLLESVMFPVHPPMYCENKSYDYNDWRKNYSHLEALLDDNVDLKRVEFVLGQDKYQLLSPAAYKKGQRKEAWAVKKKLGWTLSDPLPKHEVAQVAAKSHVAAEDDGLGAKNNDLVQHGNLC